MLFLYKLYFGYLDNFLSSFFPLSYSTFQPKKKNNHKFIMLVHVLHNFLLLYSSLRFEWEIYFGLILILNLMIQKKLMFRSLASYSLLHERNSKSEFLSKNIVCSKLYYIIYTCTKFCMAYASATCIDFDISCPYFN
jgi:hypothetical protein